MNKVLSLTQVFLKSSFKSVGFRTYDNVPNKKKSRIAKISLSIFLLVYLGGLACFLSYQMITSLMEIQQEQAFLGMILLVIAFLALIQTVFSSISILYFSKDMEFILPLPLKPREIVIAKTNVMFITEYIIEAIVGLIPLIIYGILTGAGFLYFIISLLVLLIFPILPILLSSLVVMLVMSFAKFTKNRNVFQIVATILIIALAFGIQLSIGNNGKMTDEQMIEILGQANGVVNMLADYFPTLKPAINALISNQFLSCMLELIKIIGITALAYLIYVILAQKIYLRGVIGNLYSSAKTKRKINEKTAFAKSNVAISYVKKEIRILLRNPIFFIQCVLPAILLPILFLGISIPTLMKEETIQLQQVISQMGNINSIIIVCVVLGMIQFFSMMIYVSVTAISRDGQNAIFMKYIPISLEKQLTYKAIPNVIVNFMMIVIVLGIAEYILHFSALVFLGILILAILMSMLQSYLMLLVDLKRPKLQWDSEYAVVKQNMNLVWPMVLGIINIGILVILGGILQFLPVYIGIVIIGILYGIAIYLFIKYIQQKQNYLFEKII